MRSSTLSLLYSESAFLKVSHFPASIPIRDFQLPLVTHKRAFASRPSKPGHSAPYSLIRIYLQLIFIDS